MDDVSFASLPYGAEPETLPPGTKECLFWCVAAAWPPLTDARSGHRRQEALTDVGTGAHTSRHLPEPPNAPWLCLLFHASKLAPSLVAGQVLCGCMR